MPSWTTSTETRAYAWKRWAWLGPSIAIVAALFLWDVLGAAGFLLVVFIGVPAGFMAFGIAAVLYELGAVRRDIAKVRKIIDPSAVNEKPFYRGPHTPD